MTRSFRRTRTRPHELTLVAALLAAVCSVSVAHAQEASEYDKKARAAFERKDYAGAAEAFEEAYSFKPHPATKYNAALAWDKAQQYARAADAYEAALNAEGLDTGRADAARQRLAALKPQLAYVFVSKPIGATVSAAHVKDANIPTRFHVEPGAVVLLVKRQDGRTTERKLTVKAGSSNTVAVEGDDLATSLEPATPVTTAPRETPPQKDTPKDEGSCTSCTWGWVAIGGAVVAAGAGTFFGFRTLSANEEFEDSERTDADARDRAVSSRTYANISFAVAAVAGGVGLYLVLSGKPERSEARRRSSVELGLRPGGIAGTLRF